ncbi:FAR1-related sequence 5-like protein [Tanacetum coccineum]
MYMAYLELSRQGASYIVTFTDDFSCYGYVYLLKHKHEVFETFKVFQKEVEDQLGKTIKLIRSDHRGEYMSQEFLDHLKEHGIISHCTPPYTQTTLSKSFWDYALESAASILNMVPTKKVEKTSYKVWHGQAPKLSYLKDTQRKQWVILSTTHPRTRYLLLGMLNSLRNSLITQEASGSLEDFEIIQEEDMHPSENTNLHHDEDDQEIDEPQSDVNPICRSARTQHASDRMCLYIDDEEYELGGLNEPVKYKASLLDPESDKWLDVMNVEMQSMKDNQVWDLVDLPPNGKTVGSKWLFKKKTDMDYEETFSLVVEIRAHIRAIEEPHVQGIPIPVEGTYYDTIDEAIDMYTKYAYMVGFEVKKSGQRLTKPGAVQHKYIMCNREGVSKSINVDTLDPEYSEKPKRNTTTHVTRCKARIKLVLNIVTGRYKLEQFHAKHNHMLIPKEYKHLTKKQRKMTQGEKMFVVKAATNKIGATRAYNLLSSMKGGYEHVHGTTDDFKNHQRDVNADEVAKCNCKEFGDKVSFDATFNSNKYNMKFVPFIGVDNHEKCVTLGSGMLLHEDTKSYTWLLNAFMTAFLKEPTMIVTDQDGAMKRAIEAVLRKPNTDFACGILCKKFHQSGLLIHCIDFYQTS